MSTKKENAATGNPSGNDLKIAVVNGRCNGRVGDERLRPDVPKNSNRSTPL